MAWEGAPKKKLPRTLIDPNEFHHNYHIRAPPPRPLPRMASSVSVPQFFTGSTMIPLPRTPSKRSPFPEWHPAHPHSLVPLPVPRSLGEFSNPGQSTGLGCGTCSVQSTGRLLPMFQAKISPRERFCTTSASTFCKPDMDPIDSLRSPPPGPEKASSGELTEYACFTVGRRVRSLQSLL